MMPTADKNKYRDKSKNLSNILFFLKEPVNFVWGWLFLILFFIFEAEMFLICFCFPNEPCNATKKNVWLSTIKTHCFTSFILFLSSSTHRQQLGVLQKKRFCNCAINNQKIPAKEFNFSLKLHASSLQLY